MAENPFRKKMEEKNETQLLRVINNPQQFRPKAVEAAKEVLASRKTVKESTKQEPANAVSEALQDEKIKPQYSLRAIATYQIVGSLIIMPSIFNLYPQVINNLQNTAILGFFTLLYLTGIVSGALIFQKKYEGIIGALVFNFFQSLYIQMGTVTFFSTGFFSFIYLFPFGFDGNFGNPSFLFRLQPTDEWILGINLVASTAFAFLLAAESEFHEKKVFPEHLY